jgi:predicted Holliday junction resolvase-like endonuclease
MLNNFKLYVIVSLFIAVIICCGLQRVQIIRLRGKLNACTLQQETARALYTQQLAQLKTSEQAAEKARDKTEQQMQIIMRESVSNECGKAMDYLRGYAREYQRAY